MSEARPRNRVDRQGALAATTAVVLAGIAVLATLVVPADPASAETPAERCARETATYNSAWAQTWAASNGRPASEAPPPPVPYVCHDPGPTTTTTSKPPVVTAPTVPSDTNVPEAPGPNMGAHAPTDIPAPGETPIVDVAPSVESSPNRDPREVRQEGANNSAPRVSNPLRAAPFGFPLDGKKLAYEPVAWAGSCWGSAEDRVARAEPFQRRETTTYDGWHMNAGEVTLLCGWSNGSTGSGWIHLQDHEQEWGAISADPLLWRNTADVAIQDTLLNPIGTEYQEPDKMKYCGILSEKALAGHGTPTGNFKYVTVIVSMNNDTLITAYPTAVSECSRILPGF
ncbi:MAG: hypothetical protein SW127_17920 [Actinomycetota bacterium]|nr:hypothetical protein [Actinomycetota bacterium]